MVTDLQITSAAVSDRGLSEKRPQNEDSFVELPQIGLFAVADGVGGAQAGEVASQMAMEVLAEAFANSTNSSDPSQIMRSAIESANSAIFQMARDIPQLSSMATTIVALHIEGLSATIAHVGDSRLYCISPDGIIRRETEDHSMVADEVRAGRMTEAQAENHPSKNIINRALGADATVEVDIRSTAVEPGSIFILCSDGITRHIGDEELSTFFQDQTDLDSACDRLKDTCFARGAEDNLTAVLVKVGEAASISAENVLDIEDQPTVAGRRSPFETLASDDEPLLELDSFTVPDGRSHVEAVTDSLEDVVEEPAPGLTEATVPVAASATPDSEQSRHVSGSDIQIETVTPQHTGPRDDFSMFGESGSESQEASGPGFLTRAVSTLALLLAGAVAGALVYQYWFLENRVPAGPVLTEMRSANIPQSAFEENRRNVDKDPAGYVARFGQDPQDSEDYYLLGRAYMLSGDYFRARTSFTEARNRLAGADAANAQILASDIAMGLAVTNDTTVQAIFRHELGGPVTDVGPVPGATPLANINR